ncbi:MAG: hypothetical protein IPN38_16765 [Flavobacteriales bacterium]|nr:hypothetical protein [Flavobacteriales bacterium]
MIIYSASPDIEDDAFATIHPLVKTCIKKGDAASDALVIGHLKEFIPIVAILLKVRGEAVRAMGDSLRDVYSVIKADTTDVGARRISLVVLRGAELLLPWMPVRRHHTTSSLGSNTCFPPIGDELLTGDALLQKEVTARTGELSCVVLSPSCDLVVRSGCLQKILVASCGPVSTFLKAAAVGDATTGVEKLKKSLPKHLTADQVSGYFCLPALPESLPMMVVDVKSLDLVSRSDIGKGGEHRYHRVTSVDSPFRERIAWAYIQVAGRPGVPDLDAMKMAETLIDIVKSPTPGTHAQSN